MMATRHRSRRLACQKVLGFENKWSVKVRRRGVFPTLANGRVQESLARQIALLPANSACRGSAATKSLSISAGFSTQGIRTNQVGCEASNSTVKTAAPGYMCRMRSQKKQQRASSENAV